LVELILAFACLVEVVRVLVQDALLGFGIFYKLETVSKTLKIFTKGSLVVTLAIKFNSKP
tara:strand:- start:2101 stop:2280 length:180 start_codon:yes stop_codon:yes gene_type:complete